jgi:hypothetical protein
MHRSGTTLLEKILLNHPQVFVASQPAPFLFYNTKSAFFQHKGLSRQYPLDTLFVEEEYTQQEWNSFLNDFYIGKELLEEAANKMKNYGGQWTPELLDNWNELEEGNFISVYKEVARLSHTLSKHKEVLYEGCKEIMCEEYISYFLSQGLKVFCIIRDPRDMILSTNSGNEMGEIRPTLFYLRNWRKSVAFCLSYQDHPDFCFLKFEDLVNDTEKTCSRITRFLEVKNYSDELNDLIDQSGNAWKGNSTFEELDSISSSPIGRYASLLDKNTIRFIETFCYPEMKLLGYSTQLVNEQNYSIELLNDLKESYPIKRKDFPTDYSTSKMNIELEKLRILYLLNKKQIASSDIPAFFITDSAFSKLKW